MLANHKKIIGSLVLNENVILMNEIDFKKIKRIILVECLSILPVILFDQWGDFLSSFSLVIT